MPKLFKFIISQEKLRLFTALIITKLYVKLIIVNLNFKIKILIVLFIKLIYMRISKSSVNICVKIFVNKYIL